MQEERPRQRPEIFQAYGLGLAFVAMCMLVGFNITHSFDWWGQTLFQPLVSPLLDSVAFFLTLLGESHFTGLLALGLAWRWRQRRGRQGLGPLLLFVGVGIEIVLKFVLVHPGPPVQFSHKLHLPFFLSFSAPLLLHFPTPYSFPSGHLLRTTFLAILLAEEYPRWRVLSWGVIVIAAFTRVYCNTHWSSDVIGGLLLGWTLALAAIAWLRQGESASEGRGQNCIRDGASPNPTAPRSRFASSDR